MQAKAKPKSNKSYKRLLIFYIFLLCITIFSYSETNNIFVITQSKEVISIDESFILSINVDDDIHLIKKNNTINFLKLSNDAEIISSTTIKKQKKIIFNIEIKFSKTGNKSFFWTLNNKLIDKNAIKVTVVPPILSKNSKFIWNIFDETLVNTPDEIQQGKEYFILLSGYFSENLSDNMIASIQCNANKQSVLETLNITEIKVTKNNDWLPLALFKWIPIYSGTIFLPSAKIFVSKKNGENQKNLYFIEPDKYKTVVMKTKIVDNNQNKTSPLNKQLLKNILALVQEKKETQQPIKILKLSKNVKKLHNLRLSISNTFFNFNDKKKLIKLETELKLERSLPVCQKKQAKYFLICSGICLLIFIFLKIRHKRNNGIVFIKFLIFVSIIFFSSLSYSIYEFIFIGQQKGICFSEKESIIYLSSIPETKCNYNEKLKIGETVSVLKKIDKWYLVKTQNKIKGWLKQENILLCY